jgi:heme A synthase
MIGRGRTRTKAEITISRTRTNADERGRRSRMLDFNLRMAAHHASRIALKESCMSRRRSARPSNRQILAVVAIILALLAMTGIWGVPWLTIAVIVLALIHLS